VRKDFPQKGKKHFHTMSKKVGGKINFLHKEIFMEIKCVQTLR